MITIPAHMVRIGDTVLDGYRPFLVADVRPHPDYPREIGLIDPAGIGSFHDRDNEVPVLRAR